HILKLQSSPALASVVERVGVDLAHGSSLSEALSRHPRVFDRMYLSMVRVGETSGQLPTVVARLATMLEKEAALRRKVRSAISYPVFVGVFSLAMAYALLAFLMPGFTPIFQNAGLNLPRDYPLTHFLIQASRAVTNGWVVVSAVLVLAILAVLLSWWAGTPAGALLVDRLKLWMPGLGGLVRQAAVARFCRGFSTLLQSGVPMLGALGLVGEAAGNRVVARAVERVTRTIQEGESVSRTLASTGIFPELVVQMAHVGEETGTLDDMLERVADHYDQELDAAVAQVTSLVEPALMVFVGILVGIFVMGILLPILSMSSGYQGQVR
ncbi:MAG: type II secretion system F family protein, partial [Candidatus Eremiobacterota bacterium]